MEFKKKKPQALYVRVSRQRTFLHIGNGGAEKNMN
jgi:hypothetical protein